MWLRRQSLRQARGDMRRAAWRNDVGEDRPERGLLAAPGLLNGRADGRQVGLRPGLRHRAHHHGLSVSGERFENTGRGRMSWASTDLQKRNRGRARKTRMQAGSLRYGRNRRRSADGSRTVGLPPSPIEPAGDLPADIDADERADTAEEEGPAESERIAQEPSDVAEDGGRAEDAEFAHASCIGTLRGAVEIAIKSEPKRR